MVIQDLRAYLSTINTKYDEFVTRCLIYRSVYDLCHVYRMRPDLFKGNKGPFKFAPLLTCGLTAMLVVHSCQPVSAWHGCEFPSKPENFFPLMIESCSLHVKMMLWFVSFPSAKRQCGLMLVRRHWFFLCGAAGSKLLHPFHTSHGSFAWCFKGHTKPLPQNCKTDWRKTKELSVTAMTEILLFFSNIAIS